MVDTTGPSPRAAEQRDRTLTVHRPSHPQRARPPDGELGLRVRQLLLEQLRLRQRPAELVPVEAVSPRRAPARLGRAHHAPGDPVARTVKAAERPLEPLDARQQRVLPDLPDLHAVHAVHHHLAPGRGAQRPLAADLRRARPLHAHTQDEPRILPSCASDFVRTTKTSANGAFEIHLFGPVIRWPPPDAAARVLMPAESDPASGPVRPKRPIGAPAARPGRCFAFRAPEPRAWTGYVISDDCTDIIHR